MRVRRAGLAAVTMLALGLAPSAAVAGTLTFTDPAHDIRPGLDVLSVRVSNESRVVVTVRHRDLRRAAGPSVQVYVDTNRRRLGPEFVVGVDRWEAYLWRVRRWRAYGDAPLSCAMTAGLDYRREVTRVALSRRCLGYPGPVRVSVEAYSQRSRHDWAPGYHRFSPWVPRN